MNKIPTFQFRHAVLVTAALLALPSAWAANRTWIGSTSSDWFTNANWNGGTAFASADTITFNAAGTQGSALTNTLTNSAFNVGNITFSASASAYTLSGNTFNLAGNITNNSGLLQTFSNTGGLTVNAARTFTVSPTGGIAITTGLTNTGLTGFTTTANGAGGTLTLGSLTLNTGGTAAVTQTLSGSGNINITGAVSNGSAFNHGVTIINTGTVTFAGNNTHTGLTSVGTTNGVNGAIASTVGNLVISGDQTNANGGLYLASGSTLDLRSATALSTTGTTTLSGNVLNGTGSALTLTNAASISLGGATFGSKSNTSGSGDINFGSGAVSYNGVFNTAMLGSGATFRFDGAVTNTAGNSIVGILGAGNTLVFGSTFVLATNAGTGSTFTGSGNLSLLGSVQNNTGVTNALSWSSSGTLTLAGPNTYTGATSLNTGTTILDYTSNTGTKISGTGTGGNLLLGGSAAVNLKGGAVTETVSLMTLNAGANSINRINASTGKIVGAGLTRNVGSTLALSEGGVLSTTATGGGANSLFTTATSGTTTGGVLGVVGGDDWIARDAATNLVGLSTVSSYTASTGSSVSGNADVVTDVTGTTLSASTLRFNGAAARTIDASGGLLTLAQGGILVTPAVGNNLTKITGGTVKAGSNNALIVFQNNTANGLLIESVIADGSASSTLIKSGAGLLTLANTTNTYTGKTYLNEGTLSIAADASLGAAPGTVVADQLTMSGGTLQFGANNITLSANRGITFSGGGNTIDTSGNDATIAGIIAGATNGSLTKSGAGTLFLTATNSFAGPLTIKGGTLNASTFANANSNSSIGRGSPINLAADLILDGGTLQYTGNTAASTNRQYTLTTNGGGFDASGAGTLTLSGAMTASGSSGSQTFTLTGTGTGTHSGTINNGTGTNVTALNKTGTGTWNLSAVNTYTGNTTISDGTLNLAAGSSTLFAVTNTTSTQFLGTGTVNFNGSFSFDVSGVSISNGSWTLVDVTNLAETFNLTSITSTGGLTFTKAGNIWTSNDSLWSFNQTTGILTGGSAIPEPATFAAVFGVLALGAATLRRRRSNKL